MLLPLILLSACAAVFIPAIKKGDSFGLASADYKSQAKFRDLLHKNNWPVNHSSRPKAVGQEAWNNHLLRLYDEECPGITAVWTPATLWETFLSYQILEYFPPDVDPRKAFPIDHELYKSGEGKGTALQLINKIIGLYGSFLGIDKNGDSDQILAVLEARFLNFLGTDLPLQFDVNFYKGKLAKLLGLMKAKAAEMIPADERRKYEGYYVHYRAEPDTRLQFLLEAFQDDFDRLETGQVTLCGYMAELEYEALRADDYLIIRMTDGVKLFSEAGEVVKALDWTWKFEGGKILGSPYHSMDIRQQTYSIGSPQDKIEDKRHSPQSYGYSLIAGGFVETFMPKGACCLAYASYRNGEDSLAHGTLYALRVGHGHIDQVSAFLHLPKIPLQLGFFGHGEYFHPRLTTTVEPELYHSLGIIADDPVQQENQLHDLINHFIARSAQIIQIDHRLVLDLKDGEAQKLIATQYTLANVEALRKEHIDLQQKALETRFAFDMWNNDEIHPVLRERINGIAERFGVLGSVLDKIVTRLDQGETMEQICSDEMDVCEYTNQILNRKTWVKQVLCFEADAKNWEMYYANAHWLGIDADVANPLLAHLIKSDYHGHQAKSLSPPEPSDWLSDEYDSSPAPIWVPPTLRSVVDIRALQDQCRELGLELNDYTFTIHQFG